MSKHAMKQGYVAMMDALGWKGIWGKAHVDDVIDSAEALNAAVEAADKAAPKIADTFKQTMIGLFSELSDSGKWGALLSSESRFLSDTVVVTVQSDREWAVNTRVEILQCLWAGMMAANIQQVAAEAKVPLAFRGAIASGDYFIKGNMIVGKAIDVAASAMEEADAAITWCVPDVLLYDGELDLGVFLPYRIPLHDGRSLVARAVNPFFLTNDAKLQQVRDGILGSFPEPSKISLSIEVKKQNTVAFLDVAQERWQLIRKEKFPHLAT